MVGATINTAGKVINMHRIFTDTPTRTPPSILNIGVDSVGDPVVSDTSLDVIIPIQNGTINWRCNAAMTGSNGGDNSTNQLLLYKPDGASTDNTGQNLIANASSATKTWVRTSLDNNFTATYYGGFWLYIKDTTALAKFLTSGTCLEARYRSDSTNYYAKTWTVASLSTGWNWLPVGIINTLTATGTPGTLDEFFIQITTNNSTDTLTTGDVVIDVVRSWQLSDTQQAVTSVVVDETTLQATVRTEISTLQAVGFAVDSAALKNSADDQYSEVVHSERGKGLTDEFIYITKFKHA